MLSQLKVYAVAPAKDLQRAKAWYKDKLGLEPMHGNEHVVIYAGAEGTSIVMYETPNAGTAQNTALGWQCDDVEAEVRDLKSRGVVFEEYDMPQMKTVDGIATTGDEKAAWFKDSEGNILCVSQSLK